MRKYTLILVISFIAVLGSCEYKWIEPNEVEVPTEAISFSSDIIPVFQDKCVSCHTSQTPVLTADKAYSNLISGGYINTDNPKESELYQKLEAGHPGGNALNAQELATILAWIQQGAEDN